MTPPRPRPAADRGSAAIALTITVALVLLLAAAIAGITAATGRQAAACAAQPAASHAADAIPARYLADYKKAGARYGIPWTVLAGIGTVESGNGQARLPGVRSGTNPFGAAGPMQFGVGGAAGNTWGGTPVHPAGQHTSGYGTDGDHDGTVSVYDPGDAIPSAARYLRAHGAPARTRAAVFAWNHSAAYVTQVMTWASRYATPASSPGPQCPQALPGPLPAGTAGQILAYARAQIGKPYQWGTAGPSAFDCSGLAMMAYRAAGITIPRTSQDQWAAGPRIPARQTRPGDLVFFAGADGTMTSPGHVAIIAPGHDMMIDAPQPGQTVTLQSYAGSTDLVGYARP
jgi:cell wall-associated NlpC family hydrolase